MDPEATDWHGEVLDTVLAVGRRLFDAQVTAGDVALPVPAHDASTTATSGHYGFLRRDPGPHRLEVRRDADGLRFRTPRHDTWRGPFRHGDLLRLSPSLGVRDPGRTEGGITFRVHDPSPAAPVTADERHPRESTSGPTLVSVDHGGIFEAELNMEVAGYEPQVAGTYYADAYAAFVFAWIADHLDPGTETPKRPQSVSGAQGMDGADGRDPFTPTALRRAAGAALDFVIRSYPEYQPTKLDAFGHSDFKNAPFLDAVEDHLAAHAAPDDVARWRAFYGDMVNTEGYSPTNVHALRAYWWARRNRHWPGADDWSRARPAEHLAVVAADQTPDGLIADNVRDEAFFGGSTDNHDLTYHLYALSWVARFVGLADRDGAPPGEVSLVDTARRVLVAGCGFSVALTTPAGECSYAGRSANNAYHPVSALYALAVAAGVDPDRAPRYRRAARRIWEYLRQYRDQRGDLPVGLNDHADQRMGWSHCQTPYSAANAYFLAHTLTAATAEAATGPPLGQEAPLALEAGGCVDLTGSRYAAVGTDEAHLVVFAGCERSPYPHSGLHNTGAAGIAALGTSTPAGPTAPTAKTGARPVATSGLLPILEQSLRAGDWSTSDLADLEYPDGTVVVPDGAGVLRVDGDTLVLEHAYGDIEVCHRYHLAGRVLTVDARVTVVRDTEARLVGFPGVSVRTDRGCRTELHPTGLRHRGPRGGFDLRIVEQATGSAPEDTDPISAARQRTDGTVAGPVGPEVWEVRDPSSTGRGLHRLVARPVPGPLAGGVTWRARWEIEVLDGVQAAARPETVDNLPPAPELPAAPTGQVGGVAPFLLRKLYRARSLRHTRDGVAFTVRNPLVDVHLGAVVRVAVDGVEATGPVTLRLGSHGSDVDAAGLSTDDPLAFPKGAVADVHLGGLRLAPGRHDVELALWVTEIGPVELVVSDVLDDALDGEGR